MCRGIEWFLRRDVDWPEETENSETVQDGTEKSVAEDIECSGLPHCVLATFLIMGHITWAEGAPTQSWTHQ